jgi:hypothetical protein
MSAKDSYKFEHNGNTYEVPPFSSAPAGVLRRARKAADEMDKAFTILEGIIGEDSPAFAAIDSMSLDEFGAWLQGWIGATGSSPVSLGESSGS